MCVGTVFCVLELVCVSEVVCVSELVCMSELISVSNCFCIPVPVCLPKLMMDAGTVLCTETGFEECCYSLGTLTLTKTPILRTPSRLLN